MNDFVLFVLILLSGIGLAAVINFICKGIMLLQELHRENKYLKRYKCNHEWVYHDKSFDPENYVYKFHFMCKKCYEQMTITIAKETLRKLLDKEE